MDLVPLSAKCDPKIQKGDLDGSRISVERRGDRLPARGPIRSE